jgi:glycosyltransferase involved in cell wall biosynthesis
MIESIVLFSRSTPHHHIGGMETVTWSLATEWAKMVGDVRLVTTAIPGATQPFTAEAVSVVPLPNTRPGRYSRVWWQESRRYWLAQPVAPSVVFSVSAGAYAVVRERSRHPGTPFVMQAHGTSAMEIRSKLRAPGLRSLAGVAAKNAPSLLRDLSRYGDFDSIIAVGESVSESLAAKPLKWSVPGDRVRLIPNGVRITEHGFDALARDKTRAALGIDDGVTVVACVGRLHIQKRVDRALRAAAVLRDRGHADRFRFLLVGDGPDETRLRGLAGDLQLHDMARFVGRAPREEVRDYYAASDAALLTTGWIEGLPMTMLEALACGLPCLVPAGMAGSLAQRTSVHEVDVTSPDLLADALSEVTRVPRPRVSLLPRELHLEHCAQAYLTVFEELRSSLRAEHG